MDLIKNKDLQSKIFTIRGIQVMLDRDLAELFNVEVKRLNEQVKRNVERFPENFRFSLNDDEKNELVANCDRFKSLKHSSNKSFAFTEQGVAMLPAVYFHHAITNLIPSISSTSPEINLARLRNSTSPLRTTSPSSTINFACPPVSAIPTAFKNANNSIYSPEMVNDSVFMMYQR